ncbi:MAG: hypothetical protein ACRDSR_10555 [Pseudonocardiaceae bacterium]
MTAFLPQFVGSEPGTEIKPVLFNPCLVFSGLVDAVSYVIPSEQRVPETPVFLSRVGTFAGNVASVSGTVKCAYEADRLAIRIYQHANYHWSVGAVAVIRGRLSAVADAVSCYLVGVPVPGMRRNDSLLPPEGPQPTVCAGAATPTGSDGQYYTVLFVGSSDWMCDALRNEVKR